MPPTGLIYSNVYLAHQTGDHPECPSRVKSIWSHLKMRRLLEELQVYEPRAADVEQLMMVHREDYVFRVQRLCSEGGGYLDPDTVVGPESFVAARAAVGGVFTAVDQVMLGEVKNAFCLVRPPGHHAPPDDAAGFCIFNNVALGARYCQQHHGLERVLIVDFDSHHGNGTQRAFYDDDTVFYCSVHRYPFYPGTGHENDRGAGRGEGFTLNCPIRVPRDRGKFLVTFQRAMQEIEKRFVPDFVLVSAGFDAFEEDPLAGMGLHIGDFHNITSMILEFALKTCEGRLVSTLEGGYNLEWLGPCVEQHLQAMMEA